MQNGMTSPFEMDIASPPVVLDGATADTTQRLQRLLSRIERHPDPMMQEEAAMLVGLMPHERLNKTDLLADLPNLYYRSLSTQPAAPLRVLITLQRYRDSDGPLARMAHLLIDLMHT